MSICPICQNDSLNGAACANCGKTLGSFQVSYLKTLGYFRMTVTDKYLVFGDSLNI